MSDDLLYHQEVTPRPDSSIVPYEQSSFTKFSFENSIQNIESIPLSEWLKVLGHHWIDQHLKILL
jgi:hypothetical protein